MSELIKVKSAFDDGRVALWERHRAHPNGEVFVTSHEQAVEVAETPLVLRNMAKGWLVKITPPTSAKKKAAATTTKSNK